MASPVVASRIVSVAESWIPEAMRIRFSATDRLTRLSRSTLSMTVHPPSPPSTQILVPSSADTTRLPVAGSARKAPQGVGDGPNSVTSPEARSRTRSAPSIVAYWYRPSADTKAGGQASSKSSGTLPTRFPIGLRPSALSTASSVSALGARR